MDLRSELDLLSEFSYNPMRVIIPYETILEFEFLEYLIKFRPNVSDNSFEVRRNKNQS